MALFSAEQLRSIDPGEAPLATAQRELLEETGYSAADWRRLATLYPCVGYSNERLELFIARGLKQVGNYAEVFERSLGQSSALKLDRGLNNLWSKGGLMYAAPFR